MSFGISGAQGLGSPPTADGTSTNSLRPFADLNLTEDQRTKIRAIFKNAKSQGLSQADVQQQIDAFLTPDQQKTLASDIQNAQNGPQPGTGGPPNGNPFADPNGPFANLNLTSDQQSKISTILQNAKSQGLSFDQINGQIKAVLTTSQQTTFAGDLSSLAANGPGGSIASSASSQASTANLSLTSDQESQIDAILQKAQTDGTSGADVFSQIQSVLTPAQKAALGNVQTAQTSVSGHHHHGGGGSLFTGTSNSTSSATLPNGVTETDIQNQVAAATSLVLQQLQSEVGAAA